MIGSALTKKLLQRGYKVIVFTRNPEKRQKGIFYSHWDIKAKQVDQTLLRSADFIIHLAGTGIADRRWTAKRRREIVLSRVESGRLLTESLQEYPGNLKAMICAAAIGWYGSDPATPDSRPFTESFPHSNDFLGDTCYQWEQSTAPLSEAGIRVVHLRTGVVLSEDGGVLEAFKRPLKLRLAAILGSGRQMVSWIHIDDLVALYIAALEHESYCGSYNAAAPLPVTNEALTLALAKKVCGKAFIKVHVPAVALRLLLGEMSTAVLKSVTVSSQKIQSMGFCFQFPDIETALK